MVQEHPVTHLSFFLAEKNSCLVISFIGAFSRDAVSVLEECSRQIKASRAKWIVINFRDVRPELDGGTLVTFAKLQKEARSKPAALFLCGIHPILKSTFLDQGVIRAEEITNNLHEALTAISSIDDKKVA